jgi:hypothetical protein
VVSHGGRAPQTGWTVLGFITSHGRRRGRSGSWARWRIHPSTFWRRRANASTVKSSMPRIPQRGRFSDIHLGVLIGFIRPPVGAAVIL